MFILWDNIFYIGIFSTQYRSHKNWDQVAYSNVWNLPVFKIYSLKKQIQLKFHKISNSNKCLSLTEKRG